MPPQLVRFAEACGIFGSMEERARVRDRACVVLLAVAAAACVEEAPGPPPAICEEGGGEDSFGFSIESLVDETLELSVGYAGGCGQHDFAVCWDRTFIDEGEQLLAVARVGHDAHGDNCEAHHATQITLDVSDIADGWRDVTGLEMGSLRLRLTAAAHPDHGQPASDETVLWMIE